MIREKYINGCIFDVCLFGLRLHAKHELMYKDRETGKEHYNILIILEKDICSSQNAEYKKYFEISSGWSLPKFKYSCGGSGHDDAYGLLIVSFLFCTLYLHLPFKYKPSWNPKSYGFDFWHDVDASAWILNLNWGEHSKTIDLPGSAEFYRHSVLTESGWKDFYQSEVRRLCKERNCAPVDVWNDYSVRAVDKEIIRKKYPFEYIRKDGLYQKTIATVYMEEREWRRKWFTWIPFLSIIRTTLDINFEEQLGNSEQSWKGGVTGTGCDVSKDEKNHQDFETPLHRYELLVNKIKDFD